MNTTPCRQATKKQSARKRMGTTAVEFAAVFPVILVFFLGSIWMMQGFQIRDVAQLAAYAGAREGTRFDATAEEVESKAREMTKSIGLSNVKISITPSQIERTTEEIEVTVSVPMASNSWVTGPLIPGDWSLSSSVKLRRLAED